jgi:hypothetical protein
MNATQPRDEDLIHIVPTILYRFDRERKELSAVTVPEPEGRALIVFRSEEEAEKCRGATGHYPEASGFRAVCVDHEELAAFLEAHECTHVAMPEEWTGKGNVEFFEASAFVGMLEESRPA